MPIAKRYFAYNTNGYKFRTVRRDEGLQTQNNGVFLTSNTTCVTSNNDENLRLTNLPYYGKLEDIIDEGLTPTKDGGKCLRRLSMFRKEVH